jgi:histidine triad (HIT) family protein
VEAIAKSCVFCRIVDGTEPASIIYEDEAVTSFMGIRPIHPGECMVIPKNHIDHFTDIDDHTAQHIMTVAQQIGRRVRTVFGCERVGMIVHGYGVPHAHLIIVPQHGPHDIVSGRHVGIEDGKVVFDERLCPLVARSVLDEQARLLRELPPSP